jgi:hypothetical protein
MRCWRPLSKARYAFKAAATAAFAWSRVLADWSCPDAALRALFAALLRAAKVCACCSRVTEVGAAGDGDKELVGGGVGGREDPALPHAAKIRQLAPRTRS